MCLLGFGDFVMGEERRGLVFIGGTILLGVLVTIWQNHRVKHLSREELIRDIKIMREIHTQDMP